MARTPLPNVSIEPRQRHSGTSVERWSGVWRQFLPAAAATPGRLRQTRRLVLFSLTIQFWLLVFLLFFVWAGAQAASSPRPC